MRSAHTLLTGLAIAAVLAGCAPSTEAQMQTEADAYLRSNIETLSPRASTLGGHFIVSDITWVDSDTARVTYADGHMQYVGTTDIRTDGNGVVSVTTIHLEGGQNSSSASMDGSSSSAMSDGSSSSSFSRAKAQKSEFCGGIVGIQCDTGLTCDYAGTYPDAGGTCVQ